MKLNLNVCALFFFLLLPISSCTSNNRSVVSDEMMEEALAAFNEQDYTKAIDLWLKAADQGNSVAQRNLGNCYFEGRGVPQDYEQSVYWYKRAAEQGDSNSQAALGFCYDEGLGVPQDHVQAAYWYRKAADQGNSAAQHNLGVCYAGGIGGVPQDHVQAAYWYKKAAEQGTSYSQFNLGLCYFEGRGVPQDYQQAVYWFKKAAEQGNNAAIEWLNSLISKTAWVVVNNQTTSEGIQFMRGTDYIYRTATGLTFIMPGYSRIFQIYMPIAGDNYADSITVPDWKFGPPGFQVGLQTGENDSTPLNSIKIERGKMYTIIVSGSRNDNSLKAWVSETKDILKDEIGGAW